MTTGQTSARRRIASKVIVLSRDDSVGACSKGRSAAASRPCLIPVDAFFFEILPIIQQPQAQQDCDFDYKRTASIFRYLSPLFRSQRQVLALVNTADCLSTVDPRTGVWTTRINNFSRTYILSILGQSETQTAACSTRLPWQRIPRQHSFDPFGFTFTFSVYR
jgi:hypothetical protein